LYYLGALYLNRQDIVLLESRDIPHTNFLLLQNRDHLWLVRSLISSAIAFELLQEKLLPVFQLRKIARHVNIVEEQFFIKLIITCVFNIIRELIDRTRIRLSNTKARNMFGIVDEYAILEYGQVFFQYTNMRENKLHSTKEDGANFSRDDSDQCRIFVGKVVITKNPCHHPGDLRIFDAVDCPKLRHLKDVVVFPQKGHRPHSNEVSGSDLDGSYFI
jgi:RNA-dependent RNA polymerase